MFPRLGRGRAAIIVPACAAADTLPECLRAIGRAVPVSVRDQVKNRQITGGRDWDIASGYPCFSAAMYAHAATTYRGVASGRPPSTGIVAPVVGVCRVAKKRTARPTCSAVMRAFKRLRLR